MAHRTELTSCIFCPTFHNHLCNTIDPKQSTESIFVTLHLSDSGNWNLASDLCPTLAHLSRLSHRGRRSGVYSQNMPARRSTFHKYMCGCSVCVDGGEGSRHPQIPAARPSYICLLTHADSALPSLVTLAPAPSPASQ